MMNVIVNITIQQVTPYVDANNNVTVRNDSFTVKQVHSFEVYSTWKNLTDTATVILPHNIYAYSNGKMTSWGTVYAPNNVNIMPTNTYVGGFPPVGKVPLFLRGDKITIEAGYYYPYTQNENGTYSYTTKLNTVFTGYISSVHSGIPIRLDCEDNFWLLKQMKAPPKYYPESVDNMGMIFTDLLNTVVPSTGQTLSQMGITVQRAPEGSAFFQLNVGNIRIGQAVTWADVFEDLRKKHYLYFYFRGNEFRGGGIVYYPADQTNIPFAFQKNIITNDQEDEKRSPWNLNHGKLRLNYEDKTDVNLGAMCYSNIKVQTTTTNATGQTRTSNKRLEVLVGASKTDATEFFNFWFSGISDIKLLQQAGEAQLAKYYYTGFRGKFRTFGLPYVIHGNIVNLTDNILPERNGNYLVKGVKFSGGVKEGLRQEIEIDIRTDGLDLSNGI